MASAPGGGSRRTSARPRRAPGNWWASASLPPASPAAARRGPAKRPRSPATEGGARKRRGAARAGRPAGGEAGEEDGRADGDESATPDGLAFDLGGEGGVGGGSEAGAFGGGGGAGGGGAVQGAGGIDEREVVAVEGESGVSGGGVLVKRDESGTAASCARADAVAGCSGEQTRRAEESHNRSDVDMGVDRGGMVGAGGDAEAPVSFAQASRLQFQSVDAAEGGDGIVEVAIALNVNSSYTGVLEVPARTDTGPQRALKGDEFFFVHSGQVMLELGDSRYHLHAGDHVAIPNMACYSFHNPSGSRCSLVFFVPRNPYG